MSELVDRGFVFFIECRRRRAARPSARPFRCKDRGATSLSRTTCAGADAKAPFLPAPHGSSCLLLKKKPSSFLFFPPLPSITHVLLAHTHTHTHFRMVLSQRPLGKAHKKEKEETFRVWSCFSHHIGENERSHGGRLVEPQHFRLTRRARDVPAFFSGPVVATQAKPLNSVTLGSISVALTRGPSCSGPVSARSCNSRLQPQNEYKYPNASGLSIQILNTYLRHADSPCQNS